jgi:hypothetical protein
MADVPARATFLARFPEFNGVDGDLTDLILAEAARRTNENVFLSTAVCQDAVMLRAATLLLRSPQGAKMRQANPDQIFVWEYELRMLQRANTLGLRVPGNWW